MLAQGLAIKVKCLKEGGLLLLGLYDIDNVCQLRNRIGPLWIGTRARKYRE